ncbi:hypothetical protein N9X74_02435 [Porticoccaceae bacterium]|nr:hypothetical protein [Porticoccaceae bacterium]
MISYKDNSAILLILSRGILGFCAFLSIRVISEILGNDQIESLGVIQSIVGIFSLTILWPVGTYLNQKVLGIFDAFKFKSLIKSFLIFILMCMAPLSVLIFHIWNIYIALAVVIFLVGQGTLQFLVPILNVTGYVKEFSLYTIYYSILALILSVILTLVVSASAQLWIIGQSLAFLLVAIAAYSKILSFFPGQSSSLKFFNRDNALKIGKFSLPLLILSVANWFVSFSPRIIPNLVNPQNDYAGYVIFGALSLGVFGIIEVLISQWYGPRLLRSVHALKTNIEYFNEFERYWKNCSLILLLALVCIFIFIDVIIKFGVDARFLNLKTLFLYFICIDFLRVQTYFSYQIFNLLYVGKYILYSLFAALFFETIYIAVFHNFEVIGLIENMLPLILSFQIFFLGSLYLSYWHIKNNIEIKII